MCPSPPTPRDASPSGCRRRPTRVLVIEDDHETRKALASELTRAGYVVFQAADGKKGLQAVARVEPDAIVLDLMLPEVSGFTVARGARAISASRIVSILAVSALVSEPLRMEALAAGCDAFLCKPVRAEQVIAHLRTLLAARASAAAGQS